MEYDFTKQVNHILKAYWLRNLNSHTHTSFQVNNHIIKEKIDYLLLIWNINEIVMLMNDKSATITTLINLFSVDFKLVPLLMTK